MSKRNNRNAAASNNNVRLKARYVSKHEEQITVEFNGKQVQIRRIWDSKKKEIREELQELAQIPDPYTRSISVIAVCLQAVGLKWSDAPIKEIGTVQWQEGDKTYTSPAVRIKFLQNGGQLRMVRGSDGCEKVELDIVTKTTVNQCIKDCQNWTTEDQLALDNHTAALQRRKADRERHERYEKAYVSEFSLDEAFTSVGL